MLLDTHALLWFVWDDPQLSDRPRAAIEDPSRRKLLSIASCWEIAIKVGMGKLDLGEPSATFLPREITRNNFDILSISLEHATGVERLDMHHRDPFDRILVAQAIREGVPLVSADVVFDRYGIARTW